MRQSKLTLAATGIGLLLAVEACSANQDTGRSEIDPIKGGSTGAGGKGGAKGGATGAGGTGVNINFTGGSGGVGGRQGCASADQESQLTPIYIIFIYDKSGSMGDDPNGEWQNMELRWNPMKAGMLDYFQNAGASKGVQASLEFFPAAGDKNTTCHADYSVPAVPMTSLENPAKLIAALDNTTPKGGTPTLPAVMGGIKYAQSLVAKNQFAKAIVVLVTDGEPAIYNATTQQVETDCAPVGSTLTNTIPDIATVVEAAANGTPPISTYVIGIGSGDSLSSLATIAAAGGTELILIDPVDPVATRSTITSTLEGIRERHFSCEMPMPVAPQGETLNVNMVNVDFLRSTSGRDELARSDSCAVAGWHYDDAVKPTKILLCPSACTLVQQDTAGKLSVVLGCETRIK